MARNRPVNIVIDTNLWISFIISKKYHLLDKLLYAGKVRILFSAELLEELEMTISRPKLHKYFTGDALTDMLEAFDAFTDFVVVKSDVEVCRDPKDNFLLALAKDGKAGYLLTGDKDLLDIEKFGRTKILTLTHSGIKRLRLDVCPFTDSYCPYSNRWRPADGVHGAVSAVNWLWQWNCGNDLKPLVMFGNYFKAAWRKLWKDRFYALINVFGLAISTAVFLLIVHFVQFEYSYETFLSKADDLYRITLDHYKGSEYVDTDCETFPPLGPFLQNNMPEVLDFTRVQMLEDDNEIQYRNRAFRIAYMYAVDPSMFNLFEIHFVKGGATNFDKPYQAVLTETQAKRIFGKEDPIGKTLKDQDRLLTVTGVMKDSPANTHLKLDLLVSFSTLTAIGWSIDDDWGGNNNYLYVQLPPHADFQAFNAKMHALTKTKLSDKVTVGNRFNAEPITSIHLYSHKSFEPEVNGDAKMVKFLALIAALILLVGSVNYVNLTTARAAERIKEIGMRKLLGSSRALLIRQLLMETLIINLLAMGLALLFVWLSLPYYVQLIGRSVNLDFFGTASFWLHVGLLLLFNCLISGLYPAFQLSATQPIKVVSRMFTADAGSGLLRRALIVGQFAAAIIVLSATLIVFQQLAFLKKQDIGLNPSELLVIRGPKTGADSLRREKGLALKNSLLALPQIE